jgi:hypothetical protein
MFFFSKIYQWFQKKTKPVHVNTHKIYVLILSKNRTNTRSKAVTLISALEKNSNYEQIFVDIRKYRNRCDTINGVCLTDEEFNWLIKKVKENSRGPLVCPDSINTSNLVVERLYFGIIKLQQSHNNLTQTIFLTKKEIKFLIRHCQDFDNTLKIFEDGLKSNEASKEN